MTTVYNHSNLFKILNIDVEIYTNILEKVSFRDKKLEQLYLNKKNEEMMFLQGDLISVIGWICIIFYMYFAFYDKLIFCFTIFFFLISIFIIVFKKILGNNVKLNYAQILLITLYLNLKVIYLNFLESIYKIDYSHEILRTYIFDFIASNLLSLLLIEENLVFRIILLLFNLTSIGITIINSNTIESMNSLIMDGVCSIIYYFIFYLLKKAWEHNIRKVFYQKYCLEQLLYYSYDFVKECNGLHLNLDMKETLLSGKNVKEILMYGNDMNKLDNRTDWIQNSDTSALMESLVIYKKNEIYEKKNEIYEKKNLNEHLALITQKNENSNKFKSIGIFFNSRAILIKYYEVSYRKILMNETNILDVFFYDVSDYIIAEKKIYEESLIKQKVYAKISHEFKTPINSIIGLIENIKDSLFNNDPQTTLQNLETIKNLSSYVIYLTSDIIQFTSIVNFGSLNVHTELVNFKEIVKFSYEILYCLLRCTANKYETIRPILNYDEEIDSISIFSDDVRIKQILLNFISNAVKFTKSGKIIIEAKNSVEKKVVLVSISDTGVGITEEDQRKLFNDNTFINTSVSNSLGSGLGLSICKSLANRLNLNVAFSSVYGVGTTFTLEVPYDKNKNRITQLTQVDINDPNFIEIDSFHIENQTNRSNGLRINLENIIPRHAEIHSFQPDVDVIDLIYRNEKKTPRKSTIQENNLKMISKMDNYENNSTKNFIPRKFKSSENLSNTISLGLSNNPNFTKLNKQKKEAKNQMLILNDISSNHSSQIYENSTVFMDFDMCRLYSLENLFTRTKYQILTVDDNKFINQSVKKITESIIREYHLNYEVICGSDGLDILQLIREDQDKGNLIKCVITDENMEYLCGSEAIRIIRKFEQIGKIKHVNIITSTCHEDEAIRAVIMESGSQKYLSKPLNKIELVNAFKELNII